MKIYTFDCEILTPLFMGGNGQRAELRTASFKGKTVEICCSCHFSGVLHV